MHASCFALSKTDCFQQPVRPDAISRVRHVRAAQSPTLPTGCDIRNDRDTTLDAPRAIAPNVRCATNVQLPTPIARPDRSGRNARPTSHACRGTHSRNCDADKVVATLDPIALTRGMPAFVRFDNGPEFIARAGRGLVPLQRCRQWVHRSRLTVAERLDRELQRPALRQPARSAGPHRALAHPLQPNDNRPHSAHGDLTPSEFAQAWTDRNPPALA